MAHKLPLYPIVHGVHKLLGSTCILLSEDHSPLVAIDDAPLLPIPEGPAPVCIIVAVADLGGTLT